MLTKAAAAHTADGTLLLSEQVAAADLDGIDAVLHHLRLKCAFGPGIRDTDHITGPGAACRSGRTRPRGHRLGPPDVAARADNALLIWRADTIG
ncbi:hypothetical protein V1460_16415 [Streptomyces sp. SCSIO 30461]|uniref:hypothetical protein n=1 Tax=Streptomyces sp. SCSIO 30461 TaxID=3118085 RepID=UPI0030D1B144